MPLVTTLPSYISSTLFSALNSRTNFSSSTLCHLPRMLSLTMSEASCFPPPPAPASPQFHGGVSEFGTGLHISVVFPTVSCTPTPAPMNTIPLPSYRAPAVEEIRDNTTVPANDASLGIRVMDDVSAEGLIENRPPVSHW